MYNFMTFKSVNYVAKVLVNFKWQIDELKANEVFHPNKQNLISQPDNYTIYQKTVYVTGF